MFCFEVPINICFGVNCPGYRSFIGRCELSLHFLIHFDSFNVASPCELVSKSRYRGAFRRLRNIALNHCFSTSRSWKLTTVNALNLKKVARICSSIKILWTNPTTLVWNILCLCQGLLRAATLYDIEPLKAVCLTSLGDLMTIENAADTLATASRLVTLSNLSD